MFSYLFLITIYCGLLLIIILTFFSLVKIFNLGEGKKLVIKCIVVLFLIPLTLILVIGEHYFMKGCSKMKGSIVYEICGYKYGPSYNDHYW